LPRDRSRKLAFIAGGIGVTPFRSMLEQLLHEGRPRPIVVLYGNASIDDIAYGDVIEAARQRLGVTIYYAVLEPEGATPDMKIGRIDEDMIRRAVPDLEKRTFYVSGPRPMVVAVRRILRRLGVPFWRIRTDFFPGLA
jgi:ferredoxin-NADP reductase